MTRKLDLTATWNHDPLPSLQEQSLAYLVVDIKEDATTGALPHEGAAPLNLSLVLDTSGSMAGAKLQYLKEAVRWVVDHLSARDTVAITLFDDEVHPLVGSTALDDRRALHDKIDAIQEAGGTAMSKGLLVGLDEAMKGRRAGSVSRIVVLTDGQTWGDADRCKQLAAQAGAAGIPLTALGVGAEEDWSIDLLDALAAESGGNSDYIAQPEEIAEAFRTTLRAMQETVSRNLRLRAEPASGVQIRTVYRAAPVISRLWPALDSEGEGQPQSGTLEVPLGEIQAGGSQTLLLEVVLPPRKPGQYRLARLLLDYESVDAGAAGAGEGASLDVVATFAVGAGKGSGNPRVMNIVERATTFKLQTRALQASMAGDVAAATRNLRAVATRLLNMGETELAEAAEQEAQSLEQQGQMSAAGTKKLAFETRKLSIPEAEGALSTVRFEE
jgi:Ca-activated chloride channel family protein